MLRFRADADRFRIAPESRCLEGERGVTAPIDAEKTESTSISKRGYPSKQGWTASAVRDGMAVLHDERNEVTSRSTLTDFVKIKFVPEYVEQKSIAGRRHYQAMLKHVLRPDTVDQVFKAKSRLKAIPNWPYLDKVRLCELREQHVRDLISAAFAQGYSAQTVKHIRNVLGVIIAHAKREFVFTDKNPVTGVEAPQVRRQRLLDLTIGQARTMLRMMEYPEREIALIAITTGMSVQEICGLQWKHINLEKTTVDCEGELISGQCIFLKQHWYPEGIVDLHVNRVRLIEIPQPLLMTLLRLKQEVASPEPDSFVLATPTGTPIRPASLCTMRMKVIGKQIGAPWLSWHVIRRAHDAILSELRIQLSADLVSSAW